MFELVQLIKLSMLTRQLLRPSSFKYKSPVQAVLIVAALQILEVWPLSAHNRSAIFF